MNAITEHAVLELEAQEPRQDMPLAAQQTAMAQAMPRAAVTPSDLLQVAMEADDKDIGRLERLMAMDIRYRELQEADRQRAAEIAFEADFVGFTGEAIIIPKTKAVDRGRAGSFDQAEFDEVCRRLKPALARHGFGFRHKERFGVHEVDIGGEMVRSPWVWVSCILSHRGGHKDILELDGPADTQSANTPIQNAQSSASYLKRQSLLAITGTATGGEDDENAMRKAPAAASDDKGQVGSLDTLRAAGNEEAKKGTEALTAWWSGLNARQRADMTKDFGAMRKAARAVDEGVAR